MFPCVALAVPCRLGWSKGLHQHRPVSSPSLEEWEWQGRLSWSGQVRGGSESHCGKWNKQWTQVRRLRLLELRFFISRHCLTMFPWLVSNSLSRPGWPQTCHDLILFLLSTKMTSTPLYPAYASAVSIMPEYFFILFQPTYMCVSAR